MGTALDGQDHPGYIDRIIGQKVRQIRRERQLTQAALGHALGLSAEQVQAYEAGVERIPAQRLYDLARSLGVEAEAFYAAVPKHGRSDELTELEELRGQAMAHLQAMTNVEGLRAVVQLLSVYRQSISSQTGGAGT